MDDAPAKIGRFALSERLKTNAGVGTYAGTDTSDGTAVIVKVVTAGEMSTAELLRLEHEAAVLATLSSDEFRPLLASGREDGCFYLAQPFHEGLTLQQRLLDGPLSVPDALRMAADVLERLRLAHEQGILHRDIKPENIIVRDDGRAELVDFGFARSAQLDQSLRDDAVGTIRYVAPEAAGLIHRDIDHRADLYSFGIVLFEALAGTPPFAGETAGEVLRHHLSTRAPHLRSLGAAVPAALDGVVQRLLAKEPEERYQSAAAPLADIDEIASQLARGVAEPAVTPGLHDRRQSLTEPSFIGRHDELSLFGNLLDVTRQGGGGLVLLEADSGGGKSRLLDEVALQAARRSFLVFRGQGVDQAAQRPFQVLDGVAKAIVALGDDSATVRHIRNEVGPRVAAAAAALPGLAGPLRPDDDAEQGPEAFGEARSIEALAALLDALGRRSQPAVVILDDCQWADGLTVALLSRWQARISGGRSGHVLVIAAFRSEEVSSTHPLRAIPALNRVVLAPFTEADVRALCTSMAGQLPDEALAALITLAEGSPFMASAVLRGMVESGLLRGTREGWEIQDTDLADVQTSRRAALYLARRFDLLSTSALQLLRIGGVLGKEFDLTLALDLAQLGQAEATEALHEARQRRILWVDEAENRCAFAHDKLRETLLDQLDQSDRRELHRRAAQTIESRDPGQSFELAYHFDAAGDPDRALPHAIRAADLARERHALEAAVTHYRIAERSAVNADDATRARIAEGLGDVLTLAGVYDEAAVTLQRALQLTADSADRAVIEGKLGNVAFKRGEQLTARRYLEGALRHLGRWVPRNPVARFVATMFEVFVQVMHTLLPRLFVGRRSPEGAEREFLAMQMYSRLAYIYWFSAGSIPCAWTHLRGMNLAERYPPSLELAQAYSEHAPVMTMVPWFSRGMAYARRSYEIRRDLGDVWGQGQSLNFTGVTLYTNSQYRECIEQCREAVRLLERTGDRWEQNTALWQMAFSHYRLGELATAAEIARELYSSATALGDQAAAGIVLSGWARATAGRVPATFIATELARDNDDAHTATEVHLAAGVRLLYRGELDAAVERLDEAHKIMKKAGLRQEFVAPVPSWLATAHRMRAELAMDGDPRARRKLVRRAARGARSADRLARFYPNNRPHSLRERGLTEELQRNHRRAERLLERSRSIAERQGAAFEAAQSRVAQARLATARGHTGAAERLAGAEADLELFLSFASGPAGDTPIDTRRTLSVADRFESMLQVARNIGAATTDQAIFDAVRTAALLLLRGERCHVVELGEGPAEALQTLSGEHVNDVSRSLLAEAIERRTPVVASQGSGAGLSDSIVLSEFRSALCAPILRDDRVVACFYLSHRRVDGLFGDLEIQLAEFIATAAGAALEHAAGSEARFRALVQHSSDVITVLDRDGTIIYMSDSIERVLGYQASELVGSNLRSLLDPDNAANLRDYLKPGGWPLDEAALVDAQVRHKDGGWRDVETTVTSMFGDPRVQGVVLNTRDVTERLALQAELRERAWHDALTGLANRALFTERVEHALARRARDHRPLTVAFIDLDAFKSVNDTLGHHGGDLLLKGVAGRLRDCVRPGDTIARFGGDEFALLLEDASANAAANVATRILSALDTPFELLGREVYARASIGLAVAHQSDSTETLLGAADTAMYAAKASGPSRYELFEVQMRAAALERATLRGDLEGALERGELVVHYQPVVDIATGDVIGVEALSRWKHPTRGMLGPDTFIELAEQSGLIVRLGRWVLRTSCEQAARWHRMLGRPLVVAVNVSARQFQGPSLVEDVAAVLADTGLDPASLVLEITESATVPDSEHMIKRLGELKALGIGLAIDDFGTGYSSLSYLRRFPVDQLKIDRAFVEGITTSADDRSIVAAVVDLAHALGLQVVAEGVETVDQLEQLSQLGCDLAQGYNWLRPTDSHSLRRWLQPVELPGGAVNGARPTRVLLADDRDSVRATLRIALEVEGGFEVVGEADTAAATVEMASKVHPDVVMLDVDMPGTSGVQVIPLLRAAVPSAQIMLLTALDTATVLEGGGHAADAVLDKTRGLQAIVERVAALAS